MSWQEFRERANVWLYDSKDRALGLFQWLNLAVNLSALVSLAVYYGYDHSAETAGQLFGVVKFSFGFYVLHYLVRVLYHFHPKTFFRETWAEGLLMALLAVEGAGDSSGHALLGSAVSTVLPNATDLSTCKATCWWPSSMEWMRPGSRLPRVSTSCHGVHHELPGVDRGGNVAVEHAPMTKADAVGRRLVHRHQRPVTGLMSGHHDVLHTQGTLGAAGVIQLGGLNFIAFGSFLPCPSLRR